MSTNRIPVSWRISSRSNGSTSCVEAGADGDIVRVRNSNEPIGPSIVVTAADWLTLLDQVTAGLMDYSVLAQPMESGPFSLALNRAGEVVLTCNRDVVRFTKLEWDVFVAGVTLDGEFTLEWLLQAPSPA